MLSISGVTNLSGGGVMTSVISKYKESRNGLFFLIFIVLYIDKVEPRGWLKRRHQPYYRRMAPHTGHVKFDCDYCLLLKF